MAPPKALLGNTARSFSESQIQKSSSSGPMRLRRASASASNGFGPFLDSASRWYIAAIRVTASRAKG